MRTPIPRYEAFGIASSHWAVFQQVANQMNKIIMVRCGKPSAIPWIERGFPAKPIELKIKVSEQVGLLVAGPHEYASVLGAGHSVIISTPQGFVVESRTPPRKPLSQVAPNLPGPCGAASWARQGLVLDGKLGLPFTSDYDIAAIIDLDDPRWGRTHLSEPEVGVKNLTSRFVQPVIEQLNAAMAGGSCVRGQPRIQHGTQAQVDLGSPMNRDPTRPGDESVLVFYAKPRNKVELLSCGSVEEGREELKTIMRENLPAIAAGPQGGTVIQGPWAKR